MMLVARWVLLASVAAVGIVHGHEAAVRGAHAKEGSARTTSATVAVDAATGDAIGFYDMRAVLRSLVKPANDAASPAVGHRDLLTPPIVLDFENVGNNVLVGNFYNGAGGGPNNGVTFGSSAFGLVQRDAQGTCPTNTTSSNTVLWFRDISDSTMTFPSGFTALSFRITSLFGTAITVYDGPGGTGNILANITIPATAVCGTNGTLSCDDPNGGTGIWIIFTVSFTGVAESVRFTGNVGFAILDDVTITPYEVPACTKTTYWLWNPTTNKLVSELTNNSASCIATPYNIEVRPCTAPKTTPVYITLQNSTMGLIKSQAEYFTPFYLWGDTTATGDVYPNKKPLPKGTYYLNSNIDGTVEKITFTKTC